VHADALGNPDRAAPGALRHLEIMGAYEKSVREYPNIKRGEEFKG